MSKILTVSDLHLHSGLYHQLEGVVAMHKPDVLALVGDFLDGRFPSPPGLLSPETAGLILSGLPCQSVCVRGNHDDSEMADFMAGWDPDRPPLLALHAETAVVAGIPIRGFPCLLGDESFYAKVALRRTSRKGTSGDGGFFAQLSALIHREHGALTTSLWLMHEPPVTGIASRIAVCDEWRCFVELWQPDVVVCGHDHCTPIKTGKLNVCQGRTWIINSGQSHSAKSALRYCLLDFNPNGDFQSAILYEGSRNIGSIPSKEN